MSKFFDELMESVIEMDEILRKKHRDSDSNADTSVLTFQQKQAHYDKVRRSNYLASLRIEGFETTPADAEKPLSFTHGGCRKVPAKTG